MGSNEFRVPGFEFRGRVAQRAAASDRCAPTGVRSRQPDLTQMREVRHAARRFFVAGGLASFFASLRGTNPPCIRLPASVRSDTALAIRALRTSPFAVRPSALGLRRSARSAGAREDGMPLRISEPERSEAPRAGPGEREDGSIGSGFRVSGPEDQSTPGFQPKRCPMPLLRRSTAGGTSRIDGRRRPESGSKLPHFIHHGRALPPLE